MNDARLGIVRLELPDGRSIPLQLTYERLDARGHDWMLEQLKSVQKGRTASSTALAELVEVLSGGEITASAFTAAPMAEYPLASTLKAIWATWELAQYGPGGRPATEGAANPRKPRQTWWKRLTGQPSAQG